MVHFGSRLERACQLHARGREGAEDGLNAASMIAIDPASAGFSRSATSPCPTRPALGGPLSDGDLPCVPKGRPTSSGSKRRWRWCGARSTGTAPCAGSTSSTRASRIRRCGTTLKQAEEVMRERRRLDSAIGTVNEIGPRDGRTRSKFVELGEMEGDEAVVGEGLSSLRRLGRTCRRGQSPGTARRRGRQQRHLPRNPCRRRRHREPGLGRDAAADVQPLG